MNEITVHLTAWLLGLYIAAQWRAILSFLRAPGTWVFPCVVGCYVEGVMDAESMAIKAAALARWE